MARKIYLLDTSTLIKNPSVWQQFSQCDILIPLIVLNELDKLKKQSNEAGKNARVCIRKLDDLTANQSNINNGILIENDLLIKIDTTYIELTSYPYSNLGDPSYGDTQILASLIYHWNLHPEHDVTLVSEDINLRIKAKVRGIQAISCKNKNDDLSDLYSGIQIIKDEKAGAALQEQNIINPQDYNLNLFPQECVVFQDKEGFSLSMGRKIADDKIKLIKKAYPWNMQSRNKEQSFAIDLIMDKNVDLVTLAGTAGTGKSIIAAASALEMVISRREYEKLIIYRPIESVGAEIGYVPGPQPLDAKILTPTGWTTMGKLQIGDEVISRDGKPTKVLNIFPKGIKSVYKVSTTDKVSTECCEDHLWLTKSGLEKKTNIGSVKTTKQIMSSLEDKHCLPRNEKVIFEEQKLPIPPYTMGAILGDGTIGSKITLYNTDKELINKVNDELLPLGYNLYNNSKTIAHNIVSTKDNHLGKKIKVTNLINNQINIFTSITTASEILKISKGVLRKRCRKNSIVDNKKYEFINDNKYQNDIKNSLFELGLMDSVSDIKFIPDIYKYNSVENRMNLLRGLMDTDGTIKKSGEASFSTTSKQLATDIIEVVKSLGGRAVLHSRNRLGQSNICNNQKIIKRKITYEFDISMPQDLNPFFISRKAQRHKRKYISHNNIESIEYVGEKEVQCILVENPEHLYITDNFIVTHNTIEDKLAPWFQAIMDSFEVLFSNKNGNDWKRDLEMYQRKGRIEFGAITYIRGRSIANALILIEEAQNLNNEEIKTILSRAGEGTKVIINGDLYQIDRNNLDATNNGLIHAIESFKDSYLAGHVTFTKGERSRLATLAAQVL